jgi:serine-type D-Ala-D-Ala carboxypeptidase (penicillin-binding protein 5/6)
MFRTLVLTFAGAVVLAVSVVVAPTPAARATSPVGVPDCSTHSGAGEGLLSSSLASAIPFDRGSTLSAPSITAQAAVIMDGDTGRVLYERNAYEHRRPASTTKIMTAIIAIEHGDLERTIVSDVDGSKMPGSSVMGLRPGVRITARDLLYGLLLPSGNDAAVLLAENIDGTVPAFVDEMNRKAAELGLDDTHYENPHGLDAAQHYSTAYDLARLARYAMGNPDFARIVGTVDWHLGMPSDYDLHNGNSLLTTYPGADGVKIGWTERAGWTLVASAVRDGHHLFVTVLDSQDRDADAAALLDWAFASYRWVPLADVTGALRLAQRLGVGDALVRSLSICG